ncbi:arylesterase [Sphingobium lignivorans]|uniref:arylesterase n=1 Tax=Sphingobium lignivorans TaxID=2735886 RepID=UPI0016218645|nr:arylesterase [Sphingobium lignivorans]
MERTVSLTFKFRQYGVSFLLVHLAVGCSPSQPSSEDAPVTNAAAATGNVAAPAGAPVEDARLVVVFGDSLYAGYQLEREEGFAPALERNLAARGIAARVVNAGVSGDTSAGGRGRLAFVLDGLPRKPDLVVVGLGGNDMLRGLDPAQTRANLEAILTDLKARGIPAMLTGMLAAPNMGSDYAARFNAIYPDLARAFDVPLYPFFLDGVIGDRALMLADGIHPNAQGVTAVTGRVAPLVVQALGD